MSNSSPMQDNKWQMPIKLKHENLSFCESLTHNDLAVTNVNALLRDYVFLSMMNNTITSKDTD